MEAQSATLNYSAPHAFFDGEFRYGSRGVFGVSVTLIVFSLCFGCTMLYALPAAERLARVVFVGCSAAFLLTGGYLLYLWCVRRRLPARITEEGVQYGARIWPWPAITYIGGVPMNRGVAFRIFIRGSLPPTDLPTTPAMKEEQFDYVIQKIQEHIVRHAYSTRVDLKIAPEA